MMIFVLIGFGLLVMALTAAEFLEKFYSASSLVLLAMFVSSHVNHKLYLWRG